MTSTPYGRGRTRTPEGPPPPHPWHGRAGWMVGLVPVSRWGSALGRPPGLPGRWLGMGDGDGTVDPTDYEIECFMHLTLHEMARVSGRELVLLASCWPMGSPPPEAEAAATRGESLVPYCPGIGWHWPTEDRGLPFRGAQRSLDHRDHHG